MKTAITDYFQNVIGEKYSIYFEQQDIDCLLDIIQQPSPTVTDEEIQREISSICNGGLSELTPYKIGKIVEYVKSRLSQPVRECRCHLQSQQTMCNWECIKKLIAENQPVTGYSEEEVIEAIKIAYTGGLEKLGWGESRTKAIQSLKSKPNNGSQELILTEKP